MVVFVVGNFKITELQHLQQVILPVTNGHVSSRTERLELFKVPACYFGRINAPKNIYELVCVYLFFRPYDCAETLLYKYGSLKSLRGILAYIAISTIMFSGFYEIIQ